MKNNSNDHCDNSLNAGELKALEESKEQSEKSSFCENESEEKSDSYGKFNSLQALLNAYNNLEVEFTKRSQQLKRLEKEMGELKAEQAKGGDDATDVKVLTAIADDETGSAIVAQVEPEASEESDGEDQLIAKEVAEFLSRNPSASKYAEAIALKTSERGEINSGFLERAFIEVLEEVIEGERNKITEDFIYSQALQSPAVKERIVRDYLSGIIASKGATLLTSGGSSVVMPPKKPLSIAQAGEMATKVLTKK